MRTVIRLDHVKDIVHGVRDELSRGIGKGYRVLLQLLAKLGHGEDPAKSAFAIPYVEGGSSPEGIS